MSDKLQSPDDELVFLEEPKKPELAAKQESGVAWRIMIVDDDPDVHSATIFALNNMLIQNRPLYFLHAHSAQEAKELLQIETNIALILLDVVMEQEDAGLQLVKSIRNELGLAEVRIILRTGQPGYAPEIDAIRDFDINDYKTKSELTKTKLFTAITAAVRSYDQICAINLQKRASEIATRVSRELIQQNNLQQFSEAAIRAFQEYFQQANMGLRLYKQEFRQQMPSSAITLIGGSEHNARPHNAAVKNCLVQQHHHIDVDHAALYLNNSTDNRYALFVSSDTHFTPTDLHFLTTISSSVSVCLDNILLNILLAEYAFVDPLTQLPNRVKSLHMLDSTLKHEDRANNTLALIDIDHFAAINNALGHHFGDLLLCAVADRLRNHFDQSCKIARISNDTFSIVGHNDIVRPETILALFKTPFQVEKQEVQLWSTIGLIKLDEYLGNSSDALKDTNIALKRAKNQQRGGHTYFTNKMGVEIRERVRLMRALSNAFQKNHLFAVYQPQVNMVDGTIIGAEALMRWKTVEGKYITPMQFIPIAEYSGLIIELGNWILQNACIELRQLLDAGYSDFKMSVNVSQAQFTHPEFLQSIHNAINNAGIPPHLLNLEITESVAMEDPESLIETLTELRKIGVKISIDDFGTGFSSLSYLQRLPIDQLKIDRSFVGAIVDSNSDASIPKMIIQLCQSLGLSVIAEGVEELKQAEALMAFGCPLAQGFYYSKPMDVSTLRKWMKNR